MRTIELDLINTLLASMIVLLVGRALVAKVAWLQRFSIPAPVVGGGLVYAVFVTYRVMGRNYDAAVIAGGQVGFAMSSTACALAIMKAVTLRHGLSPLAFVIVPMVGAFFIDIVNAIIIQGYLALPVFGF